MSEKTPASPYAGELGKRTKIILPDPAANAAAIEGHISFARECLGATIQPGARILDFGCGVGDGVQLLLERGYDAVGFDVKEYWGAEHDLYRKQGPVPGVAVRQRLSVVDLEDYRLPYADHSIDFCFSDQVFEHVFDYETPFRELVRVLRPGAMSLHRFPGPNRLMEGHVGLPFAQLCKHRGYLGLCAYVRSLRSGELWRGLQHGLESNMRLVNYPSAGELRRYAAAAGAQIEFVEHIDLLRRSSGRRGALLRIAGACRLDRPIAYAAKPFLQRYMVVEAGAMRCGKGVASISSPRHARSSRSKIRKQFTCL